MTISSWSQVRVVRVSSPSGPFYLLKKENNGFYSVLKNDELVKKMPTPIISYLGSLEKLCHEHARGQLPKTEIVQIFRKLVEQNYLVK